jgi:DNA mismatch repair protein MutS2
MEFDRESFRPTYRFRPHLPGSSYALEIARRAGLPEEIISRAKELVGGERSQLDELIVNLSEKLARYDSLVQDQQAKTGVVAAQEADYRQKVERLREREKQLKHQAMQEVEELLKSARKTVELVVKELREKGASADAIKVAHQALASFKKNSSLQLNVPTIEVPQPPSRELPPEPDHSKRPEVGDWVLIDDSQTPGEVTAVSSRGERICVAMGGVQLWVTTNRVKVVKAPEEQTRPARNYNILPDVPFELDLRGLDAPEALVRLDRYLYDGYSTGRKQLGVIHGKGAGVLSKFVRDALKKSALVASYRFGEYGEGDYGVTVVELKEEIGGKLPKKVKK